MTETGAELERVEPRPIQVGAVSSTPSDDEIRRMYRLAEALAASGVYKDAKQAGQAFAKILVGRDLGLSPARAMAGLHFVEGQVQVHYRTLGAFVRANGYDYRFPPAAQCPRRHTNAGDGEDENPGDSAVTIAFYGPVDPTTGERDLRGVSTFTQADAAQAELSKPTSSGKLSNYVKYPRNMLTARAMSNGIGWFIPEVLGGLPVYVEDEIPRRAELTEGSGSGSEPDVELSPAIEKILERSARLGHPSINRTTAVMTLSRRSPEVWRQWERWATAELDKIGPAKTPAPVVEAGAETAPAEEPTEVVDGEPVEEPGDGDLDGEQPADVLPDADPELEALGQRLDHLYEAVAPARREQLTDQQVNEAFAEIDHLEAEIRARRDPEQGKLDV